MRHLLRSWFGQYSLLLLLLLGLTSTVSCSKLPSLLSGGGPNVAANIQAGKTNTQTLGTTNNIAPTASVRPTARVDNIDQSNKTTVVNEVQPWLILLLILGWLLPSPQEIIRSIANIFRRK